MNDWFFMLGEPLSLAERQLAADYVAQFGFTNDYAIEGVSGWRLALQIITNPEWDRKLWDAEQQERQRLLAKANAACGQSLVRAVLSAAVTASDCAHGRAAIVAARLGCTDAGFMRAAAGAASEAAYLAALANVAGETSHHGFHAKQNLFAGGHWPLGALRGRFYIF
jgi:hypothetical protein